MAVALEFMEVVAVSAVVIARPQGSIEYALIDGVYGLMNLFIVPPWLESNINSFMARRSAYPCLPFVPIATEATFTGPWRTPRKSTPRRMRSHGVQWDFSTGAYLIIFLFCSYLLFFKLFLHPILNLSLKL